MKVNSRKYDICIECSIDDKENEIVFQKVYTVQYLREIKIPLFGSAFSNRRPTLIYICSVCGSENY